MVRLSHDLDEILTHIDKLNEIDTADVEPMAQVLFDAGETATLRPDAERPPLGNEAALANAPQAGTGYFKVPKVIETINTPEHGYRLPHHRPRFETGLAARTFSAAELAAEALRFAEAENPKTNAYLHLPPGARAGGGADAWTSRSRAARIPGRWPACRSRSRTSS